MTQTKSEQTYAEQLADALMNYETCTDDEVDEAAYELRRLSPMEAERDKLIEVNKVLVDSSKALINRYTSLVNCGDCGNWDPEDDDEVIAMRESIELAGGIK